MSNENNALARLANTMMADGTKRDAIEEFMAGSETVMLLIDTSGSMDSPVDHKEPKKCIDALREAVAVIKGEGDVPMIAFGGPYDAQVRFVDNVPDPDGGTPLHAAIDMAKQYGATRVVVISDGMPDLKDASLEAARRFGGRIDIVFVGQASSGGEVFLKELARITGGQKHQGSLANPKMLGRQVIGLLDGHVEEEKKPIIGPGFSAVEGDPAGTIEVEEEDDFDDDDEEEDEADDDDE